ncbi:50S ribosomal protein L13 [Candidatus Nomurabacteria bacterium]|nr:50S ribosomal protein L13 [Candidatus Nomurabacteria bacterium]
MNKTYSAKPSEVTRAWYLIDATDAPLGRISTEIANILTGKKKPMFTANIDCGDFVVVINSDKLVVTGNKLNDKMYYSHSGFPGGIKSMNLGQKIERDSTKVIELAVKGMLPKNKLVTDRLARLRIFTGEEHTHSAQKPTKVTFNKKEVN